MLPAFDRFMARQGEALAFFTAHEHLAIRVDELIVDAIGRARALIGDTFAACVAPARLGELARMYQRIAAALRWSLAIASGKVFS